MPATQAANRKQKQKSPPSNPRTTTTASAPLAKAQEDENSTVRLHITPFTPALLKVYLAPSILPLAENISYHSVETFPEKGFGYLELPTMEAKKLKKKLNGSTLKGSKVRIEDAKPEKRKAAEDAELADEKPAKRAKKEKKKKERGVLEGVELPEDRRVKRGWTEPVTKNKKEKKDKKDKKKQKESKYTKEPELLFNTKLTPVAATEVAHKEKSKGKKKEKKEKKKSKSTEAVIHEFENNTKQPSFLKTTKVSAEPKPAVEYINGKGWVDEDGNIVEAETSKVKNRRVLELVDTAIQPTTEKRGSTTPESEPSPKSKLKSKPAKKSKKKQATPPPSSSESEAEESSVVSSSSEDEASEASSDAEPDAKSSASSPAIAPDAPQMILTPSSPDDKKEIHPLEALFKRPKPPTLSTLSSNTTSTPAKGLAPINTSFSFFDNENDNMDIDVDNSGNPPVTPYTQRDLEWRGLRSAAPTPDTAAIGRRFSFPWRNSSQEIDEGDEDDLEAGKQLSNNTKANSSVSHLPGVTEEDEDEDGASEQDDDQNQDAEVGANETPLGARKGKNLKENGDEENEESEFQKWFWENRGDNNRAWKKRRRDTLKTKRLRENKKLTGSRRVG